ncbi:MAG: hypothetical protein EOO46_02670, partial [Flavobacterium sp.]
VNKNINSSIKIRGIQNPNQNPPLFVLDGEEISKEQVEVLSPNSIQSINVLKGLNATDKYGDKGNNGVVEITTKKQSSSEPVALSSDGKPTVNRNVTTKDSSTLKEVTVVGFKLDKNRENKNEPIFEKSEFTPSIDKDEWRAFLAKNMTPIIEYAANKNIPEGNYTVNVRFIVEKDGSLSDVSVLNDPGYGVGAKVLEMMKFAPKWKPAIQNQRVVRSYHMQPITFQIQESKEEITLNSIKASKTK